MITTRIIELLCRKYRDASPEELADALWLASREVFMPRADVPLDVDDEPAVPRDFSKDRPAPPDASPHDDDYDPDPEEDDKAQAAEDSANLSVPPAPQSSPASGPITGDRAGGLPLRAPGTRALSGARQLARALRPFRRPVPSRIDTEIDERATASQVAETGIWLPVLRPARARHFEIALVIDESPSLIIWQDMLRELRHLLEQNGGFRDVRCWYLDTSVRDSVVLRARPGATPRNPRELIAPDGKRLILVATDSLQPAWKGTGAGKVLAEWGRNQGVAILHVLPQVLWQRTALDPARGTLFVYVGATAPALPNHLLTRQLWRAPADEPPPVGVPIPVLTTQPELFAEWARLLDGAVEPRVPAVILADTPASSFNEVEQNDRTPLDRNRARELINEFRAVSSPLTFRLTQLLAAAPLRLPVMRLVQHTLLQESDQTHLAEFFLSGLIARLSPDTQVDPDWIDYDFRPHIRDLLLDRATEADALNVQRAVSKYIGERFGQVLDFDAILEMPEKAGEIATPGRIDGVFARVSAEVLKRLGGKYARAAERLLRPRQEPEPRPATDDSRVLAGRQVVWITGDRPPSPEHTAVLEREGATLRVIPQVGHDYGLLTILAGGPPFADALILDLDLPSRPLAGLEQLDSIRVKDDPVPVALFGSRAPEFNPQAEDRDAAACSNDFEEILSGLRDALARHSKVIPPLLPPRRREVLESWLKTWSFDASLARSTVDSSTTELLRELEACWLELWTVEGQQGESLLMCAQAIKVAMNADRVEIRAFDDRRSTSPVVVWPSIPTAWLSNDLAETAHKGRVTAKRFEPSNSWNCEIAVPVILDDVVRGTISVGSEIPYAFTARQILWLEMMARASVPLFRPLEPENAAVQIADIISGAADVRPGFDAVLLLRASLRMLMLPRQQRPSAQLDIARNVAEFAELWITRPLAQLLDWEEIFREWDELQHLMLTASSEQADPNPAARLAMSLASLAIALTAPSSHDARGGPSYFGEALELIQLLPKDLLSTIAQEMTGDRLRLSSASELREENSARLMHGGPLWPAGRHSQPLSRSLVANSLSVWISGGETNPLSADHQQLAQRLGYILAAAGFRLICQNRSELDRVVANAYLERLAVWGFSPKQWLTQVVAPSKPALELGSRVIDVMDDEDSIRTAKDSADAIVHIFAGPNDGWSSREGDPPALFLINSVLQALIEAGESRKATGVFEGKSGHNALVGLSLLPDRIRARIAAAPKQRRNWPPQETPLREKSAALLRQQGVLGLRTSAGIVATAIVLKEPRVILTNNATVAGQTHVTLFDSRSRQYRAEVLHATTQNRSGLAVLRAPPPLRVPGFDLANRGLVGGSTVQILPADVDAPIAGIKVRIPPATGRDRGFRQAIHVRESAAELNNRFSIHASGAPALDPRGRVVGMLVGDPVGGLGWACLNAVDWASELKAILAKAAHGPQSPAKNALRLAMRYAVTRWGSPVDLENSDFWHQNNREEFYCPICRAPLVLVRASNKADTHFRLKRNAFHTVDCIYSDPIQRLMFIASKAPSDLISMQGDSAPVIRLEVVQQALEDYRGALLRGQSRPGQAPPAVIAAPYLETLQGVLRTRAVIPAAAMPSLFQLTYLDQPVAWDDVYFEAASYPKAHESLYNGRTMLLAIEGRVLSAGPVTAQDGRVIHLMRLAVWAAQPGEDSAPIDVFAPEIWSEDPKAFEGFEKGHFVIAFGLWRQSIGEADRKPSSSARAHRQHLMVLDSFPGQLFHAIPANTRTTP